MKTDVNEHPEPHGASFTGRLNWLRAAVLGANDGIVSVAGLVVGVAGATNSRSLIFTAGLAGLVAGSLSMAAGEYVSVSSQRDSERALLAKERRELESFPQEEQAELAGIYEAKGLSRVTATQVAKELTAHDAFASHVDAELNIDPGNLTDPWQAAAASAVSFAIGAAVPMLAILLPPQGSRIPIAFIGVLVALAITGALSARVSDTQMLRPTLRVVVGGALAMLITFGVGRLFGVAGV